MLQTTKFKTTQSLTGLRAYAALAVFFIHSGGAGLRTISSNPNMSLFFNKLVDFGMHGVVVFFVLSAYTIGISLEKTKEFNYLGYIKKRLLRVVPMYYFMILLVFIIGKYSDGYAVNTYSWANLFSHLSISNLFQFQYRNNILGTEWSIPVEIFYYFLLPIAYFNLKKTNSFKYYLFFTSLILMSIRHPYLGFNFSDPPAVNYYEWSAIKYCFCFSLGLILSNIKYQISNIKYQISNIKYQISNIKYQSNHLICLVAILILYIHLDFKHDTVFMAIWTSFLILIIQSKNKLCILFFENRFIIHLGTISYSFYLIHFPVITLVEKIKLSLFSAAIVSLVLTTVISTFTYAYIEKRFVK